MISRIILAADKHCQTADDDSDDDDDDGNDDDDDNIKIILTTATASWHCQAAHAK